MTLDSVRRQLLESRDARAAIVARLCAALPPGYGLVFLSLNIPGPDKNLPELETVFDRARGSLLQSTKASGTTSLFAARAHGGPSFAPRDALPLTDAFRGREEGRDALGPWLAVVSPGEATELKRHCVDLEERLPAGRLIDLDVYDNLGQQADRRSLGLPPRRCLVCSEPAADCMRMQRHSRDELAEAVRQLLRAEDMARLAEALVEGARIELELTPKPGLVDRRDNGSHPDLSFELMERSIALLPEYYEELLRLAPDTGLKPRAATLAACVEAGRRAEERMVRAIGTNAHRGYIFLSGLVLLAGGSRIAIREMAETIVAARRAPGASHGETARLRHGVSGIVGEALAGLPSVFDHGLHALERAEARFGRTNVAHHTAMAVLMTVVEDTTTLHRCGAEGLERLRQDGRRILAAIEGGEHYVALLERMNEDYRAAGMTMGGVADCLAIAIGLRRVASG